MRKRLSREEVLAKKLRYPLSLRVFTLFLRQCNLIAIPFVVFLDKKTVLQHWKNQQSWEAPPHQSFGYNCLQVLGAFFVIAVGRILQQNAEVNGILMFAIAAFGFVLNFIMVVWLGHDHGFGVSDHSRSHRRHHGCGDSDNDQGHHHSCGHSNHIIEGGTT
ncbi:hypothetical protein TanjilG_23529 [Lupinus angustifolius]|uniref:Uncharacterized protein n=1 Tax=Lupinus angustifolius TaxID=3871 RepID=A0A4P1RAF7_LUPAN|nr:hypothetical protein TanjilG_23529 [Lupinus angustifolius]